jgi:hypothetical protein
VFSDVPLDSAALESMKIDDSSIVKIPGGQPINLEDAELKDNNTEASYWRMFWSSPFSLRLCDASETRERGFEFADEGPDQPTKGNEKQLPDWRTLMCHIEDRTSRRLKSSNQF